MKTVLTYGTFDLFHVGHYNILKRAKALGDRLLVGVTGEVYDIERGKLEVRDSLATRIANVKATGFADEIFVEEYIGQKISDVQKYNADVLVVGTDWKGKFDYLNRYCEVVYLPRTKNISSTQLRSSQLIKIGLMTDTPADGGFFTELHYLSSFHPQAIYSPDRKTALHYKKTYNVDIYHSDGISLKNFWDSIDAVYIRHSAHTRKYISGAVRNKVHIITDKLTGSAKQLTDIYTRAATANVSLIERDEMIYSRNWDQLVWMVRSGELGDIRNVNISFECENDIVRDLAMPLILISRLMGYDYDDLSGYIKKRQNARDYVFANILLRYGASFVNIQAANTGIMNDGFDIIGERAVLKAASPWADMQYFVVTPYENPDELRPFSYNAAAWKLRHYFLELKKQIEKGHPINSKFGMRDNHWLIDTIGKLQGAP